MRGNKLFSSMLLPVAAASLLETLRSYEHTKSLAKEGLNYELRWTVDATDIYVAMMAETQGWVGLGMADPGGGGMLGADVLIATPTMVRDSWSDAYAMPHEDVCQDWILEQGLRNATHTLIEASRAKDTGDAQDRVVRGSTLPRRMIAAYGPADDVTYHGSSRLAFRTEDVNREKFEALKRDPSVRRLDLINADYEIPSERTTYYNKEFTNLGFEDTVHVIAVEPIIDPNTAKYVHHFVLSGLGGDNRDSGCEAGEARTGVYCEAGQAVIGLQCDATCAPETCAMTQIAPTCADASYDQGFHCDENTGLLAATTCATGQVVPNIPGLCDCLEGAAFATGTTLYGWAPGAEPLFLPEAAGYPVGDGSISAFNLQIHYDNPSGDSGRVDNSGVAVYYTYELRDHTAGTMGFGDTTGALYGSEVATSTGMARHRFVCSSTTTTASDLGDNEVTIFGVVHHVHASGTRVATRRYSVEGDLRATYLTEYADFHFQDALDADAVAAVDDQAVFSFKGGEHVVVDCMYDERHSPQATGVFGRGSDDEMCLISLYYYPAEIGGVSCTLANGEEYCGLDAFDDDTDFERVFGAPCDVALATRDYSKFRGCATGNRTIAAAVLDDDDPDNLPAQEDTQDDSNQTDGTSSKKKASTALPVETVALIVAVGALVVAALAYFALQKRTKTEAKQSEGTDVVIVHKHIDSDKV